jgi:nucleoside-diphosphate-sugar epimerase
VARVTDGHLDAPMGRTAFVTGGSGFVGGTLIRRLRADGWVVRALARSDRAGALVAAAGASVLTGGLDDLPALADQLRGCDVAFHCAAHTAEYDRAEVFEHVNVAGTKAALEACRRAEVGRFVHVSTEAAVLAGQPLVDIDERAPLRPDSPVAYCASKARAEQAVMDIHGTSALATAIVRPRMIWGRGDTTILPSLVTSIRKGQFRWIGGGHHLTATTHVDNAVEGLIRAAQSAQSGRTWFVTDGEPIVFRDFVTALVATQGLEIPDRSMPGRVARVLAKGVEGGWRALHLRGTPPITTIAVWLSSLEVTIDISRATGELGYQPITDRASGLAALAAEWAAARSTENAPLSPPDDRKGVGHHADGL